MSSILKALEKVEQERNAQHEGPLGRFHKEHERRRGWVVPVCVVAAAAGAALVTFAAMGGLSGHKEATVQVVQVPVAPAPAAPAPAPAPAAAPATAQTALPVEAIAPPQVRTEGTAAPKESVAAKGAAAKKATAARKARPVVRDEAAVAAPRAVAKARESKGASASGASRSERKKVAKAVASVGVSPAVARPSEVPAVRPAAVSAAPQQAAASQVIRVTGIAWQKDGGKSVAMINGRQAYEGDAVEGSRIKEILQDRVRFSTPSGGTFDVPLGAGQ